MSHRFPAAIFTVGLVGLSVACTGSIAEDRAADEMTPEADRTRPLAPGGGPQGAGGASVNPGAGGNGPPVVGGMGPAAAFAPARPAMKRLTITQYRNTIKDLFGTLAVTAPSDLEADAEVEGFTALGSAAASVSQRGAEQYDSAARDVAHQVLSDPMKRLTLVGCTPQAADDACGTRFLNAFARKAWRRPVEAAELAAFLTVARQVSAVLQDPWAGLESAVAGILLSPRFLFRIDVGEPDPQDARRLRYTGYEMASRLSYFLWDSMPDEALLTAAANGQLVTTAGVRTQAERLAASSRARAAVGRFFQELTDLAQLEQVVKDGKTYPQATASLFSAMRKEMEAYFEAHAFGGKDFRDLFTSRTSFINGTLAKLYGLPAPVKPDAYASTPLPGDGPRAGLLGQAGFLTATAHTIYTSPTMRGKFIRKQLLCQEIPPPPADVVTELDDSVVTGPRTMRERFRAHTVDPACAGCHNLMDPLGLTLEHFDGIGAYRRTDNGLPIDASGNVDGIKVQDAIGLGVALRDHPAVPSCFARRLFQYATGHLDEPGERVALAAITAEFAAGGHDFRRLLVGVVASDAFRFAARTP